MIDRRAFMATSAIAVFYNIGSEQDRRDVAARNAGRLPVAVAVGDTKSTTASTMRQKPALRLIKAGS